MDRMHASHRMGMENQTFMKVAAICTWLGDFITAWMVTDMMLQVNTYIIFPLTNTEYATLTKSNTVLNVFLSYF